MTENFFLRSGYDSLDISVVVVRPDSGPVAVLQVAHGMRGHKERFLPFMTYMAAHGVVCVANDHRGHGGSVKSDEDLGYMYSGGYVALVEDMKMVTDWAHSEFPGLPFFLLGHSMGSLAVRAYMKRYDASLEGVIVCGSPSRNTLSHVALGIARLLAFFKDGRIRTGVFQNMVSWMYNRRFSSEGKEAWICSDAEQRQKFAEDRACSFDLTANGMCALMTLMRETYSDKGWIVSNPQMTVYFISGSEDPCMINEAAFHKSAQHLADRGYHNVTSAIYSGMRHEVLNEIGKEMVWEDVLSHIHDFNPADRPDA